MYLRWISLRKKGWRLYDLEQRVFFVSRDVKFCENVFPFAEKPVSVSVEEEDHLASTPIPTIPLVYEDLLSPVNGPPLTTGPTSNTNPTLSRDEEMTNVASVVSLVPPSEHEPSIQAPTSSPELLGRGHRKKVAPVTLQNFVTNTVLSKPIEDDTSRYPIANYVDCDRFSAIHQAYLAVITTGVEPKTFSQAMKDELWWNAMRDKIGALDLNKTWTIEDLPRGKKAIGCKWVYKLKCRSDGTLERHKKDLWLLAISKSRE